jgi:hypothetical protein
MRRLVALVAARGAFADPGALVFASRNGNGLVRKVARETMSQFHFDPETYLSMIRVDVAPLR